MRKLWLVYKLPVFYISQFLIIFVRDQPIQIWILITEYYCASNTFHHAAILSQLAGTHPVHNGFAFYNDTCLCSCSHTLYSWSQDCQNGANMLFCDINGEEITCVILTVSDQFVRSVKAKVLCRFTFRSDKLKSGLIQEPRDLIDYTLMMVTIFLYIQVRNIQYHPVLQGQKNCTCTCTLCLKF